MSENDRLEKISKELGKKEEPLFTTSRILFLIVVFFVISMPLVYREFSYFLK